MEAGLTKFTAIMELADAVDALLIAGDLCNGRRDWYLLPQLISLINRYAVEIEVVYGQHDMYMRSEENKDATTVGVLAQAGAVNILDADGAYYGAPGSDDYVHIQGCSWGHDVPTPPTDGATFNILVIHAPIADNPAYHGHVYTDTKEFLKQHPGYDLVLCGDVHRRFHVTHGKQMAINTGPIVRIDADDYNRELMPAVAVVDTGTREVTWYDLPAEPGDVVLSREHIEAKAANEAMLTEFVAMVKQPKTTRGMPMLDRVRGWIGANKKQTDVVDLLGELCGLTGSGTKGS